MIKRLNIYLSEMYPVIPRLVLGFIMFFEIYFLVFLTNGADRLNIGYQEVIGAVTVFSFLLCLRIADEFKDYEVDKRLFPERAYPSGRVKTKDLVTLLATVCVIMIPLNLFFMNNSLYFIVLAVYGLAMSLWFFSKHKIQKSLPLALITHNPVQLILNLYIISFSCIKYGLSIFTVNNMIILLTLYFPGLIWEISRKTRAPKDETEYVTYSKLFGYDKATKFIMIIMAFDMLTSSFLVYQIYPIAVLTVIGSYIWFLKQGAEFIKDPTRYKLVDKVIKYEYIKELTLVVMMLIYIVSRWIL
jgi:4-hydroxybenzoate polyprenyltransferase